MAGPGYQPREPKHASPYALDHVDATCISRTSDWRLQSLWRNLTQPATKSPRCVASPARFDLNAAQVCVQDPAVADSAILLTQTLVQYVCRTRVVGPSYWAYRVGRIGCCHRQQDHGWLRLDHRLAPRLTGRTWSVPVSSSDVRAPPTTERRR